MANPVDVEDDDKAPSATLDDVALFTRLQGLFPDVWRKHTEWMDGNPETVFSLTIALPISFKDNYLENSDFKLKSLMPFQCVSEQHLGNWSKLGETYGSLIPTILSGGLTMSGENREIYLNMDFQNPEANITEIQIGITEH